MAALSSKIRHFYDLDALLSIGQLRDYVLDKAFASDVESLIRHDRQAFDEPKGWGELGSLSASPLMTDFDALWTSLSPIYEKNFVFDCLSADTISGSNKVIITVILKSLEKVHIEKISAQ